MINFSISSYPRRSRFVNSMNHGFGSEKSPAQVINFLPPQSLPEIIGMLLISFRNLSFHRTGLTRINRPLVLLNFDATSIQGNLQVTFLTSQVLKSRKKFNSFPGKEKRSEKGNLFQDFWWICYGNSLGFTELWNYDMGNVCELYFHISLIFLSTLATSPLRAVMFTDVHLIFTAHWCSLFMSILILYMGVSQNSGTPKWMVYNGKPY